MSIRTNPAESWPAILNRLTNTVQTIKTDGDISLAEKIDNITYDLENISHQFSAFKMREQNLLDQFSDLDRHRYRRLDADNVRSVLDDIAEDINRMKTSLSQIHGESMNIPTDLSRRSRISLHQNGFQESSILEEKILADAAVNPIVQNLRLSYNKLELRVRICFLFLSIFPKNALLKRRALVYWWIGEGLIETEEEGEHIFQELLRHDLIVPHGNGKCPVINKCVIHPWIRYMLIALAQEAQLFDFDKGRPAFLTTTSRRSCLIGDRKDLSNDNGFEYEYVRTIFNLNESYLNFNPQFLSRTKKLVVLHLGRWQCSPNAIEVESEAFLRGLRTHKYLKYLSLRGISRITAIPSCVFELTSLEILDLKACHYLEKLPPDISSLRKLTHLDLSQCYMLENMPKGLHRLTSLQLLKGFVIGSEALIRAREFDVLRDLKSVKCLKISCGLINREYEVELSLISLPPWLEKLELEGIPLDKIPEWLKPSKVRQLKKLYIKGGKLSSLDHDDTYKWNNVEILRLKYMKHLEIVGLRKLQEMFPSLIYVQMLQNKRGEEGDDSEISEVETNTGFEWTREASD
ncbi:disease resistance RPP13-like protein 4 [Senna tora]|uniref:Disease resistance RPP13-like protein 4 n=1 Tax=Senna tora TaxID=362788 RepID=A0A835CJI5_9FABA|nr:disease resistance RPP13-like protein 4 [Senna tora]